MFVEVVVHDVGYVFVCVSSRFLFVFMLTCFVWSCVSLWFVLVVVYDFVFVLLSVVCVYVFVYVFVCVHVYGSISMYVFV